MKDDQVCWLEFVPETEAEGELAQAYRSVAGRHGRVDNLYKAMSLSAAAIEPADNLYKALLHNADCPFEPWLRELISTQVALLCGSKYAAINHGENFHDFYGNRSESEKLLTAIRQHRWPETDKEPRLPAILAFSHDLTREPEKISSSHIEKLRIAGLDDKQIVYLVQIAASFAYWARVINGLGICLGDEPIGLAGKQHNPNED